jgi:hypothetical protein
MKKSLLAIAFVAFPLSAKTTRLRTYGCITILLLAGCTATQVRWDATKMRKDVMVYYNDQIMENLIRAKNKLPFVHVDITLLTSAGGSQISGTIGAGETRTNTNTSKSSMAAALGSLGTIANAVTRPFAWSVTPQQNETLTISTAPALGSQAVAAPSAYRSELSATKETTTVDEATGKKTTVTERTLEAVPRKNIYQLYEDFAYLSGPSTRPEDGTYVPGTLKRWGTQYYYIANNKKDKEGYYEFCKQLFLKGQAGPLEKALLQSQAAATAGTKQ